MAHLRPRGGLPTPEERPKKSVLQGTGEIGVVEISSGEYPRIAQ